MENATLFKKGQSKSIDVKYQTIGDSMVIKDVDSGATRTVHRASMNIDSKLAGVPREMTLEDGDLLVIESSAAIDEWLDDGNNSKLHKFETGRKWVLASIVGVPVTFYIIFAHIIPFMAVAFADQVPYSIKQMASQKTMQMMDRTLLDPSQLEPQMIDEFQQGFDKVIAEIQSHKGYEYDYNVMFRSSDKMGPNAFALPDGTIVFTDQIVKLFDNEQHLLDAVLLHEIGHVNGNHSMQIVAESLAATIMVSYLFGDLSASLEAFFGVGSAVVQNQFTQAHESEADDFAIEGLRLLNRSPEDFAAALEQLKRESPAFAHENNWMSSHPGLNDRIGKARSENPSSDGSTDN